MTKPDWSDKTILIAEDITSNFLLLKAALKSSGAELIWVCDGFQAVDACLKNPDIDLVLMDMRMKVMDGMEASRQIRALRPKLPIIAQTCYSRDEDKEQIAKSGCNDHIVKPFRIQELIKAIQHQFALQGMKTDGHSSSGSHPKLKD